MDAPLLSTRAALALASLASQLSSLESQQAALLQSISVTNQALHQLPAYSTVAPTLSQIPTYTAKLARLKRQMAQQQQEVEALKRRAQEAGKKRRQNLQRVREREREEGERDRGVLRARMVGVEATETRSAGNTPRAGTPVGEQDGEEVERSVTPSRSATQTPVQGAVRVVRKKKKARKAEIL